MQPRTRKFSWTNIENVQMCHKSVLFSLLHDGIMLNQGIRVVPQQATDLEDDEQRIDVPRLSPIEHMELRPSLAVALTCRGCASADRLAWRKRSALRKLPRV